MLINSILQDTIVVYLHKVTRVARPTYTPFLGVITANPADASHLRTSAGP